VYLDFRVLALASPGKGLNLSFFFPAILFLISAFLLSAVDSDKLPIYFFGTLGLAICHLFFLVDDFGFGFDLLFGFGLLFFAFDLLELYIVTPL
jgi:hypothetical protein